jgi:hypothetical protein
MSNDLGIDRSGNNNSWTVNNMAFADQVVDSPTNNFATLNPLWQDSSITLQEGNLRSSRNANMNRPSFSTISLGTGKWYFEALDQYTTGNQIGVEWEGADVETYVHTSGIKAYTWSSSGSTYAEGVYDGGGSAGSVASGARIRMVAYDGATGKLWGGANGTWGSSGNPAAGTNESMTVPAAYRDKMHFVVATENSSTSQGIVANFGQDSSFAGLKTAQGNQDGNSIGDFYYTPPTGFLALCTSNLPDATVTPSEHFNTVLYTGDGTDDRSITGVGFQPDFTWIKGRNTTEWHHVYDAVRGANKSIYPNSTYQEESLSDTFESFDSDGFTVGYNASYSSVFGNKASTNYVAWNWKAGTSSNLTAGGARSIATVSSVNVDAGFEIITYTGSGTAGNTIGHSLGVAPDLLIIRRRNTANTWTVYVPPAVDHTKKIHLEVTDAVAANGTTLNSTAPTASVITLGDDNRSNGSSDTYVMYAFAEKDGYSKFGSYVGNQDADGTFVYCGFRPAFVLIKNTVTAGEGFVIMNNKSDPSNVVGTYQTVYSAAAEQGTAGTTSSRSIDFVSNGFKLRGNSTEINESGDAHVFIAFAETPFKYSNAR